VTYTFTGAAPTAVATQIGTGGYTQASLQANRLTLSIPSGTTNYSVAFLCPPIPIGTPDYQEYVVQASTQDGTSFSEYCFGLTSPQTGLATLQVNAAAISGAGDVVVLASGYHPSLPWSAGTLSFSSQLAAGTYDVFVVVYDSTGFYPLAVRVLRSQTIPGALNGGNPVVFAASDETVTQTITFNNVPAGSSPYDAPFVYFYTSNGQDLELQSYPTTTPANQYPALPAAAIQSGDYYTFNTTASSGAAGGTVAVQMATAKGGPQTFTFPVPWTYSGPTAADLPTFNFSYSGYSGLPFVEQDASIQWSLGSKWIYSIWVSATANYQNGATSLTIPALSGLTGFLPSPTSGSTIQWNAYIQQGSEYQATPPNGTDQFVVNSGTFTAP
jgi:hypothetical protein